MRRILCTLCLVFGLAGATGAAAQEVHTYRLSEDSTQLTFPSVSELDLSLSGRDAFAHQAVPFPAPGFAQGAGSPFHTHPRFDLDVAKDRLRNMAESQIHIWFPDSGEMVIRGIEVTGTIGYGAYEFLSGDDISVSFGAPGDGKIKLSGDKDGEVRMRFSYDELGLPNSKFELDMRHTDNDTFRANVTYSLRW